MPDEREVIADASRLEGLWQGQFGDAYTERNADVAGPRGPFWNMVLDRTGCTSALEVGCNVGANLDWLAQRLAPEHVYGVDVNLASLAALRQRLPEVNSVWSPARRLPFRDGLFDLVFTVAVLIHQPDGTLPIAMAEIVRCSRRWVLCAELYAPERTPVEWRGTTDALLKRDYGRIYQDTFPELSLVDEGHLSPDDGWDDVTWWLFEKDA